MGIGNIPMGEINMYEIAKQMILEGKSLRSASLLTGIDRKKLSQLLKDDGIHIQPRGITKGKSKYNHNTEAFKVIDTEEKAYWLGFLYADGSVYKSRGTLELSLGAKDVHHLERFKDFISPELTLKERTIANRHKAYRLQVTSMSIVEDLIAKGCPPAKSLKLKFPTDEMVPFELIHHFMRGYFDGDGSIYRQFDPRGDWKPQVNVEVIGTKEFLDIYASILGAQGLPTNNKYKSNGKAFGYRFGGNLLYQKFVQFLYKDATIYLERKLLLQLM